MRILIFMLNAVWLLAGCGSGDGSNTGDIETGSLVVINDQCVLPDSGYCATDFVNYCGCICSDGTVLPSSYGWCNDNGLFFTEHQDCYNGCSGRCDGGNGGLFSWCEKTKHSDWIQCIKDKSSQCKG